MANGSVLTTDTSVARFLDANKQLLYWWSSSSETKKTWIATEDCILFITMWRDTTITGNLQVTVDSKLVAYLPLTYTSAGIVNADVLVKKGQTVYGFAANGALYLQAYGLQ